MSTSRQYHVDCEAGSDAANGRRPSTAWRSLARANRAHLRPGDSLLLRRDCRWTGPLEFSWSGTRSLPITLAAYGVGARPIVEDAFQDIHVTGSWFVIQDVHVRADPPTVDIKCKDQPAGMRFGIFVDAGSRHGVIRDILATELFTGVRIQQGASDHRIIESTFQDNDMKSADPASDSGAVAVDLQGDDNEVAWNDISGSIACSHFFGGQDGSAISVYGGRHNVIHHNRSSQNHDFVELGNPRTSDTLIAYNADHSTLPEANFAVVHGKGSRYGPVSGTRIVHNTSVLTGRDSVAVGCSHQVTGDDLVLQGNILWSDHDVVTCADGFVEGDNIYWADDGQPSLTFGMAPTSRTIDPRLVDATAGDLHLRSDSPAIDAVRPMDLGDLGLVDVLGVPVPQGLAPDIGAYEYFSGPLSSPGPDGSVSPDPDPSVPPGPDPSVPPSPDPRAIGTADPNIPSGSPVDPPTAPLRPTPAPRVTPTPQPRPSAAITTVPPPTGGAGALDQLLILGVGLAAAGLSVAVYLARRTPR